MAWDARLSASCTGTGFFSGDLEAFAVGRLRRPVARTRKPMWEDVVRIEAKKSDVVAVVESGHQELVEQPP